MENKYLFVYNRIINAQIIHNRIIIISHLVISNCRWFSIGIRHNVGFLSGRGDFGGSEVGLKMFSIVGVQNKRFA